MKKAEAVLIKGTKVEITSSRYHDVMKGAIGIIDEPTEGGYGVELDGFWYVAGSARDQKVKERRIMWYPRNEFKVI